MSTIILPACLPRSKANLGATLDALDVEHRAEWQPGYDARTGTRAPGATKPTHCNEAVEDALTALAAPMPHGLLANGQLEWLGSPQGKAQGWAECSVFRAGERAEAGEPTVGTYLDLPHGHILMVRGIDENGNLLIWQAGSKNFNCATLRSAFTIQQLKSVRFFTFPN